MERIGILGGTFNPVHNGHIHLAREFYKRMGFDRLLLIPVQSPPHKSDGELLPAEDRMAMCRLAVEHEEGLEVSDIEIRRGGVSYTVDTLRILSGLNPQARLFFIMGADMFLTLEKWEKFKEVARLADLCSSSRHKGEISRLKSYAQRLKELYGANCHIENVPVFDISSTQIRGILAAGGSAKGLLPETVLQYIQKNGLYRQ